MSATEKYEVVIGLEVHVQLLTDSKLFCRCANRYGSSPNTQICPVCTGQPGALPVINKKAIELGVKAGLALKGEIQQTSIFARKNYFYPDLPKGYQISQYEKPYCLGGSLTISLSEGKKEIALTRIHFEEDAGKSMHGSEGTCVDLNRAGVPLCEIVSEPVMHSPEEAGAYLRALHRLVQYADICDGNMQEGSFRCDANISLRPKGQKELGTKVELKNLNSFRYVEKALEYEVKRQTMALEGNQPIVQQTRLWNEAKGVTEAMREKEQAHDYRYFPEPDLAPLKLSAKWIAELKEQLPELPHEKFLRFVTDFELNEADADLLCSSKALAAYFEQTAAKSNHPKLSANWIANELLAKLKESHIPLEQCRVTAEQLAELIRKIESAEISGKMAKSVFEQMFQTGKDAPSIIAEQGLAQISDVSALEPVVTEIIKANGEQVEQYRAGKTKVMGFFVGQVMKKTKGQANPKMVNDLVRKLLENK